MKRQYADSSRATRRKYTDILYYYVLCVSFFFLFLIV